MERELAELTKKVADEEEKRQKLLEQERRKQGGIPAEIDAYNRAQKEKELREHRAGAQSAGNELNPRQSGGLAGGLASLFGGGNAAQAVGSSVGSFGGATASGTLAAMGTKLGPVSAGLGLATTAMQGVGAAAKAVGSAFGPVGMAVGELVAKLAVVPGMINSILGTLTSFGELASPAAMKRLEFAVTDTAAVIGQSFVPFMDLMRDGIRAFGDILANILPNQDEVRAALMEFQQELSGLYDSMREMAAELGPVLRGIVIEGIKMLGNALVQLAHMARGAMMMLTALAKVLEAMGLITLGDPNAQRSSIGAAARQAGMTSFDEYRKQLQIRAFTEPGRPTAQDMPKSVFNIEKAVNTIVAWTELMTPGGLMAAFSDVLNPFADGGAGRAAHDGADAGRVRGADDGGGGVINAINAQLAQVRARLGF